MIQNKKMQIVQDTLSGVDGLLVALNSYPDIEDAILEKAQGLMNYALGKLFPTQLDFAKLVLEHLVGTDALIKIVSGFLTAALPEVEVGLKAALLANMQNLGTNCTIDPIIYEKAIKEGIVFDLRQIDLYDKLTVSPLDEKIGQYYYFGIDGCESSYDVLLSAIDPNNQTKSGKERWAKKQKEKLGEDAPTQKEGSNYLNRMYTDSVGHYFGGRKRDFDCLLWYMKNKGVTRQVWGKRTSASEDIFLTPENGVVDWLNKKGNKKTTYYQIGDGGEIKIYEYYDAKWHESSNFAATVGTASIAPLVRENIYVFSVGKYTYRCSYGNPPIVKLNRKKYYYVENYDNANYKLSHDIYFYDSTSNKWDCNASTEIRKYATVQELYDNTSLKSGDFAFVENKVLVIEIEEKNNKKKVKTKECIDITNDFKQNISLFIDYDETVKYTIKEGGNEKEIEKKKGDIIKDDKTPLPVSSLADTNTGTAKWKKKLITADKLREEEKYYEDNGGNKIIKPKFNNGYYVDKNTTDGGYNPLVDELLIPLRNATAEVCVNLDTKMANSKYSKDFGVVTLEYSPRTGNILQSDGKPMKQQTPYDNALHVFFGNVKEFPTGPLKTAENEWKESSDSNRDAQTVLNEFIEIQKLHKESFRYYNKKNKSKVQKNNNQQTFSEAFDFYDKLLNGGTTTVGNTTYTFSNDFNGSFGFVENGITDENALSQGLNVIIKQIKTEIIDKCNSFYQIAKDENKEVDVIVFDSALFEESKENLAKTLKFGINNGEGYYSISALVNAVARIMDKNESLYYLRASNNLSYPEAKKNYYLHHTLYEFNVDYINSLQLFDPKVLAAQIVTSLFGSMTMGVALGATVSWKTELIRDVVKNMIEKTIAAEDFAVSDCFFTFTNDAYNGMLRATELRQAGLYSKSGEENGNNKIDPVKLLEGLNQLDSCADQAEQIDIINGVILNASGEVSKDVYNEKNYLSINSNFGVSMTFVETLMLNLCTQLVMAMLSPKVYLLILINLELFGMSTNFDIKAFLEKFEGLIRSIVKSVVDHFMQYLTDKIKELIEELTQKLVRKLALEQVEMYARLIKQIIMHIRMLVNRVNGGTVGWTMDDIGFADIKDGQEPIDEC